MDVLLEVDGLQTIFETPQGMIEAVRGVSFVIGRGEVVGLVGESGCGKSVTALSLLRLIAPPGRIVGGKVWFEGHDLLRLSRDALRRIRGNRIAMTFQDPMAALNPVIPIGRQATEALRAHRHISQRQAEQHMIALAEALGFPNAASRFHDYPHQLSGGGRQRMMMAIALACDPNLLIADEPTTALDTTIQAQVLAQLRILNETSGMAILFITHHLGLLAGIAHRVLVMHAGCIVEEATTEELFTNPKSPYTLELLRALPQMHSAYLPSHTISNTHFPLPNA